MLLIYYLSVKKHSKMYAGYPNYVALPGETNIPMITI